MVKRGTSPALGPRWEAGWVVWYETGQGYGTVWRLHEEPDVAMAKVRQAVMPHREPNRGWGPIKALRLVLDVPIWIGGITIGIFMVATGDGYRSWQGSDRGRLRHEGPQ